MTRRRSHLAQPHAIEAARRAGEKVEAACGSRVYPLTEDEARALPTCARCQAVTQATRWFFAWTNLATEDDA